MVPVMPTVGTSFLRFTSDQRRARVSLIRQPVVGVPVEMGYGGTTGRASRLGKSGDGGVDGVIEQDALGL